MRKRTVKHSHKRLQRLLVNDTKPLPSVPTGAFERVSLPFDTLPTLEEWKARVAEGGSRAYHAQKHLERLQQGQPPQTELSYPVQAWTFGDELAVVFLASEVVVDYSLRLKRELDVERLWVGAYSNAFPGYIPSERVLAEGGYEGGGAMLYFGPPTRFAPGVEQLVIDTVHKLFARRIFSSRSVTEGPNPNPRPGRFGFPTEPHRK